MSMKVLERPIGSIPYAAGQTRTLELPRHYAYRKLFLTLICPGLDKTADSGTAKDSCPAQLVRSVGVRANGRDQIKQLDMEALHRLGVLKYGTRPCIFMPQNFHDGSSSSTDAELKIQATIDFEMWRGIRPADTFYKSGSLATFELIVQFGNLNDIMGDDYGGSVTINGDQTPELYVDSLEAVGMPDDVQTMINKESVFTQQISQSGAHHLNIPTGNIYRQIAVRCKDSNGYNVDDLIDELKLQSGTEVYKLVNAQRLQFANRLEYQSEDLRNSDLADMSINKTAMTGWYLLDFVKDGRLTESLDTSKLSQLELVMNVSSSGTTSGQIDVYPTELLMPAGIERQAG